MFFLIKKHKLKVATYINTSLMHKRCLLLRLISRCDAYKQPKSQKCSSLILEPYMLILMYELLWLYCQLIVSES